ncbi:hypothetical protein Ahia01_000997100, partial [Argonauta hians]
MLSERVVIALSRSYVQTTWHVLQEALQALTRSSLHRQRLVVVLLEDCPIPAPLRAVGHLDVRHEQFYTALTQLLRSNCLPRSCDSISSGLSSVMSTRANMSNGQLIGTVTGRIHGQWKAGLVFDYDGSVPAPLSCHGINVTHREFNSVMKTIITDDGDTVPSLGWQFTMKPLVVLFCLSLLWIVSFLLVIFLLLDAPKSSALPIRLAVFLFPLLLLVAGYALRRMQKQQCAAIALGMLHRCVQANQTLYRLDRPVLVTASLHDGHKFLINFIYFDISECVLNINFCLSEFTDSLTEKLLALIHFYTMDTLYMANHSIAEKLVVMLSGPYCHHLQHRSLLKPSVEHHVRGHMCLCHYAEEFLLHYFTALHHCTNNSNNNNNNNGASSPSSTSSSVSSAASQCTPGGAGGGAGGGMLVVGAVFSQYLNCTIRKDSYGRVRDMLKIDDDDDDDDD